MWTYDELPSSLWVVDVDSVGEFIYVGGADGVVHKVSAASGERVWEFADPSIDWVDKLMVNPAGGVYVMPGTSLFKITEDGEQEWKIDYITGYLIGINSSGNLIIGAGHMFEVTPSGAIVQDTYIEGLYSSNVFAAALGNDDCVYLLMDRYLAKIDSQFNVLFQVPIETQFGTAGIALGPKRSAAVNSMGLGSGLTLI